MANRFRQIDEWKGGQGKSVDGAAAGVAEVRSADFP